MIAQLDLLTAPQEMTNAKTRVAHDYYPTPEAITQALLDHVDIRGGIYEPCAGEGAIAKVLRSADTINFVLETDLVYRRNVAWVADATLPEKWSKVDAHMQYHHSSLDWVITNPPFSVAFAILRLAWKHVRVGVACLLRLSFLEPCRDRAQWLNDQADHMTLVMPVSPRPKFRRDTHKSDSMTVAWCVWRKDFSWKALGMDSPFQYCWGWRRHNQNE